MKSTIRADDKKECQTRLESRAEKLEKWKAMKKKAKARATPARKRTGSYQQRMQLKEQENILFEK